MGMLLLGLAVGLGVGMVLGRRQAPAASPPSPAPAASPPRPPAVSRPPVVAPNKRAAKAGLTEADFTPSDDILHRMQLAWEHGVPLDELDAIDAVPPATPAGAPDEPGVPDPETDEKLRRVLERLDGAPPEPEPEVPVTAPTPAPATVTEALAALAADGYGDDLRIDGPAVACARCGHVHPTERVEVDRALRFEGPSDPADEAIVLGLRCPECGAKGALVSAFGPDADPALADAFVYLADRARHR